MKLYEIAAKMGTITVSPVDGAAASNKLICWLIGNIYLSIFLLVSIFVCLPHSLINIFLCWMTKSIINRWSLIRIQLTYHSSLEYNINSTFFEKIQFFFILNSLIKWKRPNSVFDYRNRKIRSSKNYKFWFGYFILDTIRQISTSTK